MNKLKITLEDFQKAANALRTDITTIQTVGEVESRGEPFYADGFPVILFERHKFHKFTGGEFDSQYPVISNPKAGGYGKGGQNQRNKFSLAFSLDPIAAMKSCSWGKFQIMGFNYELCGFSSVGAFVDAMKESEGEQLLAFVNFVKNTGLSDELRNHQWAKFAQGYNGADYKENNYDTKLAAAYKRFSAQKISFPPKLSDPPAEIPAPIQPESSGDASTDSTQNTADAADVPKTDVIEAKTDGAEDKPPTELCKERPSSFVRWFVAVKSFFGYIIAGMGSWIGFDDVKEVLKDKAGALDAATVQVLALVLFKTALIVGAGVLLAYLASKLYDHAANRANGLNMQKLIGAQSKDLNTAEFKS